MTKKKRMLTRDELFDMYREVTEEVAVRQEEHRKDVSADHNAKMRGEYHVALKRRTALAIAIANMVTGVEENAP